VDLYVEFLDHTLFWNAVDLERKLELFKDYYNHSRTHASLDGNTPAVISGDRVAQLAPLNSYAWKKHCGSLFQLPVAAWVTIRHEQASPGSFVHL